jgi:hypothetical protein
LNYSRISSSFGYRTGRVEIIISEIQFNMSYQTTDFHAPRIAGTRIAAVVDPTEMFMKTGTNSPPKTVVGKTSFGGGFQIAKRETGDKKVRSSSPGAYTAASKRAGFSPKTTRPDFSFRGDVVEDLEGTLS